MVLRILHFILGAALGAGGGYLLWTQREGLESIFPPGASGLPLLPLLGLLGGVGGIVFLVSAVYPRPNQRRWAAEQAAREQEALARAEAYYSDRSRAAERDWRSGDVTPLAAPRPATQPTAPSAPQPVPSPAPVMRPPPPPPQPAPVAAATIADASGRTAPAAPPPNPFPSAATLAPLPRPASAPAASAPVTATQPVAHGPHADIASALASGRLAEAEQMLNTARETATGLDLAELTALAGNHAAASGKTGHARWLWRLALKRFGEHGALDSPTALAIAERLRAAG